MPREIDLANWNRRPHYHFFRDFDNPFFNVCVNVDVTRLIDFVRDDPDSSFFVALHYVLGRAANSVESMKYRIRDNAVIVCDSVDIGTIVLRDDEAFAFCYIDYVKDYRDFLASTTKSIDSARTDDESLEPADWKDDIIHCTVLPWISFTSFAHARRFGLRDSVPKIASGKYFESEGRMLMPVSVEVHHALMDGLHVSRYYDAVQGFLDDPSAWAS